MKNQLLDLEKDRQFQELQIFMNQPNIFNILKIATKEFAHTQFLAWLLNPQENHQLNNLFLEKFLKMLSSNSPSNKGQNLDQLIGLDTLVIAEGRISEHEQIDIMLINHRTNSICVIENKVKSNEHDVQLSRYSAIIHQKYSNYDSHFVLLCPSLRKFQGDIPPHFIQIEYSTIFPLIREMLTEEKCNQNTTQLLSQYLYILETEKKFMINKEIKQQCREIYQSHKKAIDLINKCKEEDFQNEFEMIGDLIEETGFLRYNSKDSNRNEIKFVPEDLFQHYLDLGLNIEGDVWIIYCALLKTEKGYDLRFFFGEEYPNSDQNQLRTQVYEYIRKNPSLFSASSKITPLYNKLLLKKDYLLNKPNAEDSNRQAFRKILEQFHVEFRKEINYLKGFKPTSPY